MRLTLDFIVDITAVGTNIPGHNSLFPICSITGVIASEVAALMRASSSATRSDRFAHSTSEPRSRPSGAALGSNPIAGKLAAQRRRAVFADDRVFVGGIDLDLVDIAIRPFDHTRVHYLSEEGRDQRYEEHAGIAGRQFREAPEVAKRLVAARRVRMVIGMALKMEQDQVGRDVIAV